jgi:phosphate transport system substrate-binding protein
MSQASLFKRFLVVLLSASILLAACSGAQAQTQPSSQAQKGTLVISGAFALYPMMVTWAEEYQKLHPEVRIDVSAGGAGKGMTDALSGAVDIGMVSRDITPDEESKGAYWIAVTKDAVFATANAGNPVAAILISQGITQETLEKIYISGEYTTWGQVVSQPDVQDEVHVYTRSDSCGAAEVWAKYLGDKKQEDLLGIGVNADPGVMEAVVKDPLAIGYNNLNYAFDAGSGRPVTGAIVIPLDVNGNGQADPDELLDTKDKALQAVASGRYPSPPARTLNLVTRGKPGRLVQDFLLWILGDGQQFVEATGYVKLSPDQLAQQQARLK